MSANIPVLFSTGFQSGSGWAGGEAYVNAMIGHATGTTAAASGHGNPLHWVAMVDRKNPTGAPAFMGYAPNNSTVPAGIEPYLTDQYIMFWASAAFCNNMPQGDLYAMLAANGGAAELERMETLTTVMACGVNGALVYLLVSVPQGGVPGMERLMQRSVSMSEGTGNDITYVYKNAPYQILCQLMAGEGGDYFPITF